MLLPDQILNRRYRIVEKCGRGGMGTVYKAQDERLALTVAIKECAFDEAELRRLFTQEAHLVAKLRHRAIARVIDHFDEGECQYLVMDYVEGPTLADIPQAELFVPRVLAWGEQLLEALAFLHAQSPPIIHRDIKPQNLKLWPDDSIVLLDFGLAKGGGPAGGLIPSRTVVGYTPHYASFEQMQGRGTEARSDLYSFAATMYRLLTGTVPPDATSRAVATSDGRPDPFCATLEAAPHVPPGIAAVVDKGMAIAKAGRFESAAMMLEAWRACTNAQAVPVPPFVPPTAPAAVDRSATTVAPPPSTPASPEAVVALASPARRNIVLVVVVTSFAVGVAIVVALGGVAMWRVAHEPEKPGADAAAQSAPTLGRVLADWQIHGLAFISDDLLAISGRELAGQQIGQVLTVSVRDLTGVPKSLFKWQGEDFTDLAISPVRDRLVTVGPHGAPAFWSVPDRRPIGRAEAGDDMPVRFSHDGSIAIVDATRVVDRKTVVSIDVIDGGSGRLIRSHPMKAMAISSALSPDGRSIAVIINPGVRPQVLIFDAATGARLKLLDMAPTYVAWLPDGHHLAVRQRDQSMAVVDTSTWAEVSRMPLPGPLTFSPDARWLASPDVTDTRTVIRNLQTGAQRTLPAAPSRIAFSPNGRLVATANPGAIDVYTTEDGARVAGVP